MTNIGLIRFNSKYNVKYMNGIYVLSGFDHIISLRISEEKISDILGSGLENFSQDEWNDFVSDYTKEK